MTATRPLRALSGAAVAVALAAAAAGCGGGAAPPASSARPANGAAAPAAAGTGTPAAASPDAAAPPAGTVLTTDNDSGGILNVIPGGNGFSIEHNLLGGSDSAPTEISTVTTFNAAGQRLAQTAPGAMSGDCGAADLTVPGAGRLILTEKVSVQPAKGIEPATYGVTLNAWNADTAAPVWQARIIAPGQEATSCGTDEGDVLEDFSATSDGRYGLIIWSYNTPVSDVVNLATGAMRADPRALGTLGGYVVDGSSDGGPATITDPATGRAVGRFTQAREALCNAPGIALENSQELADSGAFFTDSAGSSPPDGLAASGADLLAIQSSPTATAVCRGTVAAYALPGIRPLWHLPVQDGDGYYLWSDSGGVAVIGNTDFTTGDGYLIGVSDTTGRQVWKIPGTAQVCAATGSQLMLAVNNQLAVVNVRTGQQVSYAANNTSDGSCPVILPGGIEVTGTSDGAGTVVTQVLAP